MGPSAYGGTALIRALAGIPYVQPLLMGERLVQTVSIFDVADIAVQAVTGDIPAGTDVDLVESTAHTLRHIVARFRSWLALAPPRFTFATPRWIGAAVARCTDALGLLGWRSPLRSTVLRVLDQDALGDPEPLGDLTGRELPATLQERWFARLYLAMPLVLFTLAFFWWFAGVVTLLDLPHAVAVLPLPDGRSGFAEGVIVAGVIVDIGLGLTVLIRRYAKLACIGMIALTVFYLFAGTLISPDLWLDPHGPLVKTLPGLMLALVAIILLEDR